MKRIVGLVLAVALVVGVGPAWAREVKGKVTRYDTTTRVITLEDGTQYVVTEKVKIKETIKQGTKVKLTYDEREGKNWITGLEEEEAP
jgi:hypothetical protein